MARIVADLPKDEHYYVKMCCAKLGISIKDFVTNAVISKVEEYEDLWSVEQMEEQERDPSERISHKQVLKDLGINDI